jgi:hypothetical protein
MLLVCGLLCTVFIPAYLGCGELGVRPKQLSLGGDKMNILNKKIFLLSPNVELLRQSKENSISNRVFFKVRHFLEGWPL